MENAAPALRPPRAITCRSLAWGFARIGLSGIGGVLPYAHHTIVEDERWLTDREFTEVLSVAQLLPGPNIANVAILLGTRFRGAAGAAAALAGLFVPPLLVFIAIAILYRAVCRHRVAEARVRRHRRRGRRAHPRHGAQARGCAAAEGVGRRDRAL